MSKKGPQPKTKLPKAIRENIVESKLPVEVMEAIKDAVELINKEPEAAPVDEYVRPGSVAGESGRTYKGKRKGVRIFAK